MSGSGTTAIAAKVALSSGFQYARIITSYSLIGMPETARISHIYKVIHL